MGAARRPTGSARWAMRFRLCALLVGLCLVLRGEGYEERRGSPLNDGLVTLLESQPALGETTSAGASNEDGNNNQAASIADQHARRYQGRKGPSPRVHPKDVIEKSDAAQLVKSEVAKLAKRRDKLYTQWHGMRKNCVLLREQNRDFEEEVLNEGHMILLGLQMKLSVEKRAINLKKSEKAPQDQYTAEVKRSQISQKKTYKAMIANRHAADKVCASEVELEQKFKEALGRYDEAAMHMKWRLAHGCFHHGLAHYCVRVTKWCGKGTNVRPCWANAVMQAAADGASLAPPAPNPK